MIVSFLQDPSNHGCPKPCTEEYFNPLISTIHGQESNDTMKLYPYYSAFTVEKKIQTFNNTPITFLSNIGGTVGLLLGYSLLSVFLYVLKIAENYYE